MLRYDTVSVNKYLLAFYRSLLPPFPECTDREDGGSNVVRNFHKHLQIYMTSYYRTIIFLVSRILADLRVGLLPQLRHRPLDSCILGPYFNYRVYKTSAVRIIMRNDLETK